MRIKIIGLLLGIVFLFGCGSIRLPSLNPIQKVAYTNKRNYNKKYYRNTKTGETIYEISKGSEKTTPKKTMMESFGAWVSGLSFIAFIAIIAGMFLAPGLTVSILFSLWRRTRRAFIETVRGIKQANAVNDSDTLHNSLKAYQSTNTQRMVGEVKSKL